jgi:predicted DNA-binding protein (UPF0251 family)
VYTGHKINSFSSDRKGSGMVDPKLMENWFKLMAEAMRGTRDAQEALQSLPSTNNPAELTAWMMRWMPAGTANAPDAFREWLEDWYKMMGVVPRSRYLEALERCDQLRVRLEEAEATIKRLQPTPGANLDEAQKAMDAWQSTMQATLKAQSEWMQRFMSPGTSSGMPDKDAKNEGT